MLLQTEYVIDDHLATDQKMWTWAREHMHYELARELMKIMPLDKKAPSRRFKTFDEDQRVVPDLHYGFITTTVLRLRIWVTYTYPTSCPVGDEVDHADFIAMFPDALKDSYFLMTYPRPMRFVQCQMRINDEILTFWRRKE